ncbi:MAG: HAMP domain-containing sensor histidine kinase [Oligoflexia bacterium]|nr:HAMP domain-containing sensor histidine kinase [Oligoflexia bacterium]
MKQSSLLRFLLLGFLISIALGLASFYALRSLNESSTTEERRHLILFTAQIVESGPYSETVQDTHLRGRGRHAFGSNLWVVSRDGAILATNAEDRLPIDWDSIQKPSGIHDFTFHYRPFRLVPDLMLVKLDAPADTYLLMNPRRPPPPGGLLEVQIAFFCFVVGTALLIALILIYAYSRKKSAEARTVLSRLEKGDLKARFEIKRIDEIGSLMLDFNRMASEIERLVGRVQETEMARKHLLEELSHDIRTPLTSLKTSIETLSEHLDEMPKEQQREFLEISRAELTYFLQLIDDLFFIADLGEPRYKQTTQRVDLAEIIGQEVKSRRASSSLHWGFERGRFERAGESEEEAILGDPLLIQRLIKNALDNSAKHAKSKIEIRVEPVNDEIRVVVENDGPGISDEAIALFGERRKLRVPPKGRGHDISLGLGSVIMKTILELHGGGLKIARVDQGTRLTLEIPRKYSLH